jgi:hypothetical protein
MNPPPPVTRADRVRKGPSVKSSARSSTAKTPKHSFLAQEEDTAEAVGVVVALTAPPLGPPIHTSGMTVEFSQKAVVRGDGSRKRTIRIL